MSTKTTTETLSRSGEIIRRESAKSARTLAQKEASKRLFRLIANGDQSMGKVADACGIHKSKVQRWCDEESKETPTVADLERMPREVAVGLLRHLAEAHGLALIDAPTAAASVINLADWVREAAEATGAYADAVSDGTVTLEEARDVRREFVDAFEKAGQILASLDLLIEEKSA